ncbi:helix-turn-helix domain-containing protein [Bacillus sp. FJAT-49736]|uniref:AraC family transcriptional regulator n=1 Tax=Bacillus sp. FJAT-49736 TaxID=2833582 RepID=UPI001BC923F0|nr:helix-turn-helix domain-containing protein [Bacillus sp. FJAT-49736]MBS4172244.1 helix-turn-helix transcriptional regulator [Bacillus sp. FJAT-49736]
MKLPNTKLMLSRFDSFSSDPVEHEHGDDYQITIPLEGSTFLDQNKVVNKVESSKHFLTFPGEKHFHFTEENKSRILLVNINKHFLDHVISTKLNNHVNELEFFNHIDYSSEKLIKTADEMIKLNLFDNENEIRTEELEWELVELFLSLQKGTHSEWWEKEYKVNSNPIIKNVIGYMEENYSNDLSLDILADHCRLSKFYLIKLFKEALGCTPSQFLLRIRLEHAKDLLLKTNFDITRICFEVGFGSLSTFERVFKKRWGMTISEFRKKHKA